MDLYPTLLRAAGIELAPEEPLEGLDLAPLWNGADSLGRDRLHFFLPHRDAQAALRAGDWKLVHWFGRGNELYDLSRDVGEQRDLAAAEPERVAAIEAELFAWIRSTGATLPVPNPHHDPSANTGGEGEDE
jgi:arylsulfatase A-like enzyme